MISFLKITRISFFLCALAMLHISSLALAESEPQILITVAQTNDQDAKVFRSFSRNYKATKKYGNELQVKRLVNAIARDYNLIESGDAWTIKSLGVYCALLTLPEDESMEELLAILRGDKRIETAQPVYNYSSRAHTDNYNDPYFSVQYKNSQAVVEKLHEQATGKGIRIAVIDTGVDTQHSDLSNQISKIYNFVDDDAAQFNSDIHGTAVTGIIAAQANNELGIVGLAPNAELWVMKACWQVQQKSDAAECNSFTLANALSVGIDENIDIFNLSLSGPRDPLIERLIETAIKNGIIVVAADPVIGHHRYPALLSGVIDVQQMSADENFTSVSKQDLLSASVEKFTIRVNGTEVLSTAPNDSFEFFSGSSMSN